MTIGRSVGILVGVVGLWVAGQGEVARAAELTIELGNAQGVKMVGAFNRWDQDGNPRRQVNPKARIDQPEVDATATDEGGGRWVFKDLSAGKYDLVILLDGKVRLEGWTYAPVLEFDPFFPPDAPVSDEVRETVTRDIAGARHYENKVSPLYLGGNDQMVRILMMLLRDLPTSYEREMPGAATLRFEIWQYDGKYGAWTKERRTRVLHRIIMPRGELRQWTWLWDPKLGGIEASSSPKTIKYDVPSPSDQTLKGLRPY